MSNQSAAENQSVIKPRRGGYRPGAGRPRGLIGAKPKGEAWAPSIARIKNRLRDHAFGTVELSSTQVKAAEVLLDRHEPRLASIEAVQQDPRDLGNPADFFSKVVSMLAANPALHAKLNAAVDSVRSATQATDLVGDSLVSVIMSNEADAASTPQIELDKACLDHAPTPG